MSLQLTIDSDNLAQAMARGPEVLKRHMALAIGRTVQEMARSAKRNAPKAFSTLTNAIAGIQASALEGLVVANVDYARAVEEGTGGGAVPPERAIEDWIKVKRIQPRDPRMTQTDLAFVIARSIAIKGTPAKPFMAPAFDDNRVRAERRIDRAISSALKEMMQ